MLSLAGYLLVLAAFLVALVQADDGGNPIRILASSDDENTSTLPSIDSSVYRICANASYIGSNVDITSTLYNCVANMADPVCVPSYLNGTNVTDVRLAYKINNLMSVAEIEMTATIDFFFRIYWVDQRFNFPELWELLADSKPELLLDGIELRDMIRDVSNPLKVWMPNIYMTNAKEVSFLAETIRLRPGGMVFWSRHAVATLQQPGFGKLHVLYI